MMQHALILFSALLTFISVADCANIASCAQCTVNAAARWCRDDMTCHLKGNCSCKTDCISFTDCFLQEETCAGCIGSGGVFCTGPPNSGKSCFLPDDSNKANGWDPAFPREERCGDACLPSGRCLVRPTECPRGSEKLFLFGCIYLTAIITAGLWILIAVILCCGARKATAPDVECWGVRE